MFVPSTLPSVRVLLAWPLASVVSVEDASVPPPAVTEKVTDHPSKVRAVLI